MTGTVERVKGDFPIFQNHPQLVYLDNASTTQTPQVVMDAMNAYYSRHRANIHRGVYQLSSEATELYESARKVVANFIGADFEEIVFTSGTTHGLNLLAQTLCRDLKVGDNVVITRMEHHANLIPWQEMARWRGFEIRFVELENYELRIHNQELSKIIDENTKVVSVTHISNTLGTVNPVKEIVAKAKRVGAVTIVDAAQSVAHMPIDVRDIDCDFLVFSGHKLYGPTGIGILYGKRERLEALPPFLFGGDMIREVTFEKATWNDVPWKFESGTPNIAGAIGLAAAIQYVKKIGLKDIGSHEAELTAYALEQLGKISGLQIIGPSTNRIGVISFTIDGIHPHDVASILDNKHHVALRAGHHCTMPLMQYLGIHGTTRISLGFYNTKKDVDTLTCGLTKVRDVFVP